MKKKLLLLKGTNQNMDVEDIKGIVCAMGKYKDYV